LKIIKIRNIRNIRKTHKNKKNKFNYIKINNFEHRHNFLIIKLNDKIILNLIE